MQKHLKISINDKQYSIATDENDADVYSAAHLVDSMIKGKVGKSQVNNGETVATIVALHLATDLAKTQKLLQACEDRLGKLLDVCNKEA